MTLRGLGIWTAQFDFHPAHIVRDTVQELEELGYGSLWVGENIGREPISQASFLLAATQRMVVATAIANLWARDALAMTAAQQTLSEAYPGRFIMGIGVSHRKLVGQRGGDRYSKPLQVTRDYLTAMTEQERAYRAVPAETTVRLLGALGPRMLQLAADLADGAHTYLVPPEHTAAARKQLGSGKFLVPEQAVILEQDRTLAYDIARRHLRRYLSLTNYTQNLRRLGFTSDDFENHGSNRLLDALIAWGDESAIADRIRRHHQAGADHVAIQVLDQDFHALPLPQWRRLASIGHEVVEAGHRSSC